MDDLSDELLAGVVVRVRLAGKQDLHRTRGPRGSGAGAGMSRSTRWPACRWQSGGQANGQRRRVKTSSRSAAVELVAPAE